ncbi:MAG: DNA polymerase III subunit gamma/tau [Saprospirales bacterium]|nr:DNA polymerase III subunit gamma/tau [Saprospirales bacterium]
MSYIVSARKYRPQRFSEVVGQEHVSLTLKKELQTDHLAHAFLFCGPRGVGKTTCARILAKALNCTNLTEDFEPCGKCNSCTSFQDNASFNIIELDAASNNSVEHIRALVEQVRFQPQQGQYKVFIIDEVHMLSTSAFNAFLKTLEEPPPYAVFILATTEKHKILPTILSRCQVFDFKRITVQAIVKHLQGICEAEKIKADREALHIIAQKADGALRDALSIFDRVVSSAGKKLTYEAVVSNLNILDYEYYFKVTDALLVQDMPTVMLLFEEVLYNGFDGDVFINGLAEHFRNLLLCKHKELGKLVEAGEDLRKRYEEQAAKAPKSFLLTALNLCNDCDINYKMARNKRLHVEMYLIKMCHIGMAVKLATNPPQQPVPEKKTPELTSPAGKAAPAASPKIAEEKQQPLPPSENEAPVEPSEHIAEESTSETSPAVDIAKEAEPEKVEIPEEKPAAPKRKLRKPSNGLVSGITSLEDIEKEVDHEEKLASQREAKLSPEDFQEQWKAYKEQVTSSSVKAILNNAEARLEGTKVCITVSSSLAENAIKQETKLMDFLRENLHAPMLSLDIKVDPGKQANEKRPPRPLTDSEKYQQMKAVNPLVDELRKQLDLRFKD